MTVFHNSNRYNHSFTAKDIIIGNTEVVAALAQKFIIDMTETNIDSMFESGEEITRQFALDHLECVKQCATDYAHDVIGDLQTAVKQRIMEIACEMYVNAIRYDDDGKVEDVEVRVNFR